MEFDKKTILAFILIGLILVIVNTDFYQRFVFGDRSTSEMPADSPSDSTMTGRNVADDSIRAVQSQPSEPEKPEKTARVDRQVVEADEREIVVETPIYRGVFSSLGGTVKDWKIKTYSDEEGYPVHMIKNGKGNLALSLPMGPDTLDTAILNFRCDTDSITLAPGETFKLEFEREVEPGKFIRKTYDLDADRYAFDLAIEFRDIQQSIEGYHYIVRWDSGLAPTEKALSRDMENTRAYAYIGDDVDDLDVGGDAYKEEEFEDRDISWTAIRTKYFATAIIPKDEAARGAHLSGRATEVPNKDVKLKTYAMSMRLPLSSSQPKDAHRFQVYIGPLEYDTVQHLNVELEQIMNLGWGPIQPFSKIVVWALKALHQFVPNYGIVIIIFSVFVKLLLHPLTKKSYQSMAQMQALQPKLAELREKHSKDPQKLNTEMMGLYREYGVNPLGGCLPMLLQMPLLIALFTVFGSTIEFRQAYFFGWISDLSAPDTIFTLPFSIPFYGSNVNVLPLVMCITMFIQQKLSVTDPKQKAMIYIMPVVFAVIFNNFPSGLNLYYALFNIFSIIQQKMTPKPSLELKKKKTGKKKSSMQRMRKGGLNAALSRKRLMGK